MVRKHTDRSVSLDIGNRMSPLAQHQERGGLESDPRRNPRSRLALQATLCQCLTCFGRWPVRDISAGGAYVSVPGRHLRLGTCVELGLVDANVPRQPARFAVGRVIRVEPQGVALSFSLMSPELQAELSAFLASP